MRRTLSALTIAALLAQTSFAAATPFINEFHYDNSSTDVNEFIELAGGVGWDLTGWKLVLYNGNPSSRSVYATRDLSGTFTNDTGNGWGFRTFSFASNGLQNGGSGTGFTSGGEPDGFALVDASNNVVQFLSYEGSFTAAGTASASNPAGGLTSASITTAGNGVYENGSQVRYWSLSLTGTQTSGTAGGSLGSQPNGFTWATPAQGTPFTGAAGGTGTYSVSGGTTGDYSLPTTASTFQGAVNTGQTFTAPPPAPPPPPTVTDLKINQIQGAAQRSPYEGSLVRTQGIVTQLASNGYYIQSTISDDDNDTRTSDGLFVFTSSAPSGVAVGDLVRVQGSVTEFLPGGATNNLTTTEITSPTTTYVNSGNTVRVTTIGAGGRTPPTSAIETSTQLSNHDPVNAGRDFYESLEGMVVKVQNATAVAPTTFIGTNREVWVRSDAPTNSLSSRGSLVIAGSADASNVQRADYNPERIQIDPASASNALVQPGDRLGDVVGVVSYNFGNFEIVPTTAPSVLQAATLPRETADFRGGASRLTYASYNLENLQNGQTARYAELASDIIGRLKRPDILGVQEIVTTGDNGQPQDPAATLQGIVNAIKAAGGGTYAYAFLPVQGSVDDRIVSAYLYNTRRVSLVAGSLSYVPGTTAAASAYNDARAPLVAQFLFNGQVVTTINNHWSSRGGSQSLFGLNQPPVNGSEDRRLGQGQELNAYVRGLLASNPKANIIVNGDLNSFYFEDPQAALRGAAGDQVLFGLYELLALNERYSYSFDGNAQQLDYIYASGALFNGKTLFDIVHFNSEYLTQFSDHDPVIASFVVPEPAAAALLFLGVAGLVRLRRRSRI